LRIDSVIVRPTGQSGANQWLLGVLLDGKVYLFDPRLGLPVPSSDKLTPTSAPATLAEIPAHPEWLQQLDVKNDEYPIKAESLKQVDIQPIIDIGSWTRRIQQLESVLPAEVLCVLSDPLSDEAGRSGYLSRLKAAGWNPETLKPWAYPQQQREAIKSATPAMQMSFEVGRKILSVPIPYKISESNELSFGHPERKLLRIRTEQLLGKFEDATQHYLSIRHMEIEQAPIRELAELNRLAAENAIYWTAVSKFEFKEYEAAIEQINAYLKRYDRSGRWRFAARALLADCHAELGRFKEAADSLERSRSDDPYRLGNAARVKMWKAKAE
jgi:tetratricopeptide (TPR) repeat protein